MCGRYRRRSDKQRIAEAFEVVMGLEELYPGARRRHRAGIDAAGDLRQ